MNIDFKEKTYEKYFSNEIARLTDTTFSPDQVDEGLLGFDDAFLVPIDWLRAHAFYFRASRGARMSGIRIQDHADLIAEFEHRMPPFHFNLFVQYKRPEYVRSHSALEWPNWRTAYFRYRITPHQQTLLDELDGRARGRAATVYASPAFWKATDLWARVKNSTIVASSNIACVARLRGHGHYTYRDAGSRGLGHSETSEISSPSLNEIIATGRSSGEPLPLSQHLKLTAKLIAEVIDESDSHSRALYSMVRELRDRPDLPANSLAAALLTIEAFSKAFDVALFPVPSEP